MKIFATIFIYISLLTFATNQSQLYKFVLVSQQRGAACLDGTPPGYYVHEGFGENKNNYLIYFVGGGYCGESTLSTTIQSCYKRSFTNLGSSKYQLPYIDTTGLGILSTDVKENPLFYDWTKFGVIYCDGSQYLGYRENPIPYKDTQLFFRGSRNAKQVFIHMNEHYGIYNGNSIVITGTSAGGMATFQWSNYVQQNSKTAKVYALPDSGFFITDFFSSITNRKNLREKSGPLLNLVYSKEEMPEPIVKCLQISGFDMVDCVNAGNYAQFIKTPIFLVQSPYDQYSLRNIVEATCLSNKKAPYSIQNCNNNSKNAIEEYRIKSIEYLKLMKGNRKDVGIWGPACVQHGYEPDNSYNNPNYQVQGSKLMQAIQRFLKDPHNAEWQLDQFAWPGNQGCSGLNAQLRNTQNQDIFDLNTNIFTIQ